MRICILIFLVVACTGCVSGYKQFYHDNTYGRSYAELHVELTKNPPRLVIGTNPEVDSREMLQNNYIQIGYSSFNGKLEGTEGALSMAKSLNAEVVITYSQFTGSETRIATYDTPTTQTSYSTANVTAYGSNGWANAYGTGTTTTYGTRTNYVPYTVDRYNQGATYWIKRKPPIFGAMVDELSENDKKSIGSNKGVKVMIVIKDSPAYDADIIEGDILKAINGTEIKDSNHYFEVLSENATNLVSFRFYRGGKIQTKKIQLSGVY
jgi:hypothetical protein